MVWKLMFLLIQILMRCFHWQSCLNLCCSVKLWTSWYLKAYFSSSCSPFISIKALMLIVLLIRFFSSQYSLPFHTLLYLLSIGWGDTAVRRCTCHERRLFMIPHTMDMVNSKSGRPVVWCSQERYWTMLEEENRPNGRQLSNIKQPDC